MTMQKINKIIFSLILNINNAIYKKTFKDISFNYYYCKILYLYIIYD